MAADGSVIIDTRMDTSGVQNGVSAIRQSFNGLGSVVKKIGVLIGGAFAIGELTQFGKFFVYQFNAVEEDVKKYALELIKKSFKEFE